MNLGWILRAAFLVLVSTSVPTEAQEECPRIRKDWDVLTPTEKDTYKRALAAAMDSGVYIKFVDIHTNMHSHMNAHGNCMFGLWHRCFLLAFENMLRAQGPEFVCLTLPYMNTLQIQSRLLAGTCSSLGDCSAIFKELGGYGNGVWQTVHVSGRKTEGMCEKEPPLNHFCQSRNVSGNDCVGCCTRRNYGTVNVPASANLASLREQLFGSKNFANMSKRIERGCHNDIHSSLGGMMNTAASPGDPLFWSLHAMIDLFIVIGYKCHFGTQRLTYDERLSHPFASFDCTKRNGDKVKLTDVVFMGTGARGTTTIDVRLDPILGPYFSTFPDQYIALMDTRDLGADSYTYQIQGQLAELFLYCDGTSAPARTTTGNGRKLEAENGLLSNIRRESACEDVPNKNSSLLSSNVLGATTVTVASTTSSLQNDLGTNIMNVITVATKSLEEELVSSWYDKTMSDMGGQCPEVMADLESQVCMYENQCLGGTPEYSAEFQAEWGVMESRCMTIVKAIKSGQKKIMHANWRQDMESFFGCPQPANATQTASQASDYGSVVDISILPNVVPSV
ncbi:unnamed protein product [Peronospora belbahrii]|uniref:Tyrosinase copper-binding domain-containing protein n=1 Tax=Peronospora belbahrii TaxID=622444 RepID=A0ABN8CQI3_9STRA|nr:unnamed protein product [Peronospora belbahrii]